MRVPRSRWGRWAAASVVAAVGVGLFVHFSEHVVTVPIVRVAATGDARLVIGAGCGIPSSVDVRESATAVRVRVRSRVERWGGAVPKCLTMTCIRLARPLGARTVVDDATGKAVPVDHVAPGFGLSRCITPGRLST